MFVLFKISQNHYKDNIGIYVCIYRLYIGIATISHKLQKMTRKHIHTIILLFHYMFSFILIIISPYILYIISFIFLLHIKMLIKLDTYI